MVKRFPNHRSAGFTLVEVLVALGVLALLIALIAQLFNNTSAASSISTAHLEADARVRLLLDEVGLGAAFASRYPHECSGGQRQRVGIARALAVEPDFLVCDEPVSALDLSVQAQIIAVLQELQRTRGLTYLFIAHDLGLVAQIATRIAVMQQGRLVEIGATADVIGHPAAAYTRDLLAAVPTLDPAARRRRTESPPHG